MVSMSCGALAIPIILIVNTVRLYTNRDAEPSFGNKDNVVILVGVFDDSVVYKFYMDMNNESIAHIIEIYVADISETNMAFVFKESKKGMPANFDRWRSEMNDYNNGFFVSRFEDWYAPLKSLFNKEYGGDFSKGP